MSGITAERVLPLEAIARTLPASASFDITVIASNIISTCPPMTAVRAPELSLCGTCTMSSPAIDLKSSPAM